MVDAITGTLLIFCTMCGIFTVLGLVEQLVEFLWKQWRK